MTVQYAKFFQGVLTETYLHVNHVMPKVSSSIHLSCFAEWPLHTLRRFTLVLAGGHGCMMTLREAHAMPEKVEFQIVYCTE